MLITWQRTLLFRLLLHFSWILLSIFTLIILIDYTSIYSFDSSIPSYETLKLRYLKLFVTEIDTIIPLSLLLTSFLTTFFILERGELLCMTASGYSLKKSLFPYLMFGLMGMIIVIIVQNRVAIHLPEGSLKNKEKLLYSLPLEELGCLICHKQTQKNILNDLFWIESADKIHYIEEISFQSVPTIAHNIFTLRRERDGSWSLLEKMKYKSLPDSITLKEVDETMLDFERQNFTILIKGIQNSCHHKYQFRAQLAFRLYCVVISLFFALLSPLFTFYFSRTYPWFYLLCIQLISILLLRILSSCCMIMSVMDTMVPTVALVLLMCIMFGIIGKRYVFL